MRWILAVLLVLLPASAWGATYLGNFVEDATVHFKWSTNDTDGASITRGTDGTVSVYCGSSDTQLTAGVTDTEDFDSTTGVHHVTIDLSASASYAAGSECQVVLTGAVIDSLTVNAVLAHFSIARPKDQTPSEGRLALKKGTTSYVAYVYVKDQRTGGPLTGLTFDASSLTAYYTRTDQGNAGATACTLATATRGSFTSCGFVEKDATNAPGWYEFGVPNAAIASGAPSATVTLKGAANMAPAKLFIELVDSLPSDIATLIGTPAESDLATDIVNAHTDVTTLLTRSAGTYRKNVASQRKHPFFLRSTTSVQSGLTGGTVTVQVDKDGAGFNNATGTVAESGNGWYWFTPSQADLNCDSCAFKATATGAVPAGWYIFTIP